jgi:cell division protein FtsB
MVDTLLALVESQRRDIETLIQMAQEKDKRIDELTQDVMELQQENNLLKMDSIMLTPNGLGNARDVEDSLSASAI